MLNLLCDDFIIFEFHPLSS